MFSNFHVVFNRECLIGKSDSLKLALHPERESSCSYFLAVFTCRKPLETIRDFLEIASKIAGKVDGALLSRRFAQCFWMGM